MSENITEITVNTFYKSLSERVSTDNAKLLVQTAAIKAGTDLTDTNKPMDREAVEKICLELINSGGPSFQVGRSIYSLIQ